MDVILAAVLLLLLVVVVVVVVTALVFGNRKPIFAFETFQRLAAVLYRDVTYTFSVKTSVKIKKRSHAMPACFLHMCGALVQLAVAATSSSCRYVFSSWRSEL
jgi:hypothetical protein